jgi:bifunctional DNA-binding transcriptional regulator/antitoxin component of YhaV-PrlF toxin-antitoxin module
MALVRVRERGEITLPRELQEALKVREGGILLKPVSAAERETAWQWIEQARNAVRYAGPGPAPLR